MKILEGVPLNDRIPPIFGRKCQKLMGQLWSYQEVVKWLAEDHEK